MGAEESVREALLKAGEYHLDSARDDDGGGLGSGAAAALGAASRMKSIAAGARGYRKGEAETIRRVLDEIEVLSLRRMAEGFNELNFSVGVFNCLFIAYMFGAHPEHLWLIYLSQGSFLIPRKFYNMWNAKPLNQALYYLDFCWCMNFTAFFFHHPVGVRGASYPR